MGVTKEFLSAVGELLKGREQPPEYSSDQTIEELAVELRKLTAGAKFVTSDGWRICHDKLVDQLVKERLAMVELCARATDHPKELERRFDFTTTLQLVIDTLDKVVIDQLAAEERTNERQMSEAEQVLADAELANLAVTK